ncbi:MAG: methionine--tRNA ligase subunit beta [Nitrososphaerales archaeon]
MSFEEFSKIDLRIGKIVEAEMVPGAKRLIRLKIDLGGEIKQSIAGLGEHYKPEDLKSKLVVVVTNLKPRKIFGLDSEVMLLAAIDGQTVSLIEPDKKISVGSKVT